MKKKRKKRKRGRLRRTIYAECTRVLARGRLHVSRECSDRLFGEGNGGSKKETRNNNSGEEKKNGGKKGGIE